MLINGFMYPISVQSINNVLWYIEDIRLPVCLAVQVAGDAVFVPHEDSELPGSRVLHRTLSCLYSEEGKRFAWVSEIYTQDYTLYAPFAIRESLTQGVERASKESKEEERTHLRATLQWMQRCGLSGGSTCY